MESSTVVSEDTNSEAPLILIVDDEAGIRRTLEGVFADEGYRTVVADSGVEALDLLDELEPALVLLDIWMPGMDGMETLKELKFRAPEMPVIMISGHATISTAMQATRFGATDFIEKPLDLDLMVQAVRRAIGSEEEVAEPPSMDEDAPDVAELSIGQEQSVAVNPVVFSSQKACGGLVPQRTLANSTLLYGHGVHTGQKSGLILEPLPPNSGIHFVGVSGLSPVPAHVDYVESTGYATTIRLGETQVGTIEHLMSALHAYGISNLLIKCNGEVPVLDGSAMEFCRFIEEAGLVEQEGDWFEFALDKVIRVGDDKEYVQYEPGEVFTIEYTLSYPEPVGTQNYTFTLDGPDSFKDEIASARTFGFVRDIEALQKQGLAQGGRFDNFVLIGDEGAINVDLRYPDEAVRHKILDVIGDLYLMGRPLRGKITACMTGHSDNIELLRALIKAQS